MPVYQSRMRRMTRREVVRQLSTLGAGLATVPRAVTRGRAASLQGGGDVRFPEGAIIRTILRDVSPEALAGGATLFHEHLSLSDPRPSWLSPAEDVLAGSVGSRSFTADLDLMADEVNATGQEGVTCIVNGGTKDLGQNPARLRALAERTHVHIVLAGGLWTQPRYPPDIAEKTEEQVADDFHRDATAERWGAIGEIGSSMTMHPDERKVLRASCRLHIRTGLPLFTHTPHQGCPECAIEQLDIIEEMGVNPRLVCIGHLADITGDPRAETHIGLARRGAFLGFDTVGHQITQGDAKKVEMIVSVIEAGFEDHILLSADFAREAELKAYGGAGYSSVTAIFVPKLRYAGVPEEVIQKILVDNPRRFLAFVPRDA